MAISFMANFGRILRKFDLWLNNTPERALDQAYSAALKIKALENQHFDGNPVTNSSGKYSQTAFALIQSDLNNHLQALDVRLKEFKASRAIVNSTNSAKRSLNIATTAAEDFDQNAVVLEKINFIDEILARYKAGSAHSLALVPVPPPGTATQAMARTDGGGKAPDWYAEDLNEQGDGFLDRTGVLPRSITTSLNRIKQELDPTSEQKVVQSFRSTQTKTRIAIRFLLLMIALPLLTQQVSKPLLIGPIVDHFRHPDRAQIFLNAELREEALRELSLFEEQLRFENFIGRFDAPVFSAPGLKPPQAEPTPASKAESGRPAIPNSERPNSERPNSERAAEWPTPSLEERLKEKAQEIAEEYGQRSSDAVKNIFSDLLGVLVFVGFIASRRQDFATLKSFIDERVYGLSDSAKAFIIILFTDIFVGFHSPHGWEVLLESICGHLGIPSNHNFNGIFIATFPVILDTIFKYWIFRYLNRISPSAVATYKNMNE
jgi:hypothetical protein